MIRYENDSECIFIRKMKGKNELIFSFLPDKRIYENPCSGLITLFERLREKADGGSD